MFCLSDESTGAVMTPALGVMEKGTEWPHESDSYSCFFSFGQVCVNLSKYVIVNSSKQSVNREYLKLLMC